MLDGMGGPIGMAEGIMFRSGGPRSTRSSVDLTRHPSNDQVGRRGLREEIVNHMIKCEEARSLPCLAPSARRTTLSEVRRPFQPPTKRGISMTHTFGFQEVGSRWARLLAGSRHGSAAVWGVLRRGARSVTHHRVCRIRGGNDAASGCIGSPGHLGRRKARGRDQVYLRIGVRGLNAQRGV